MRLSVARRSGVRRRSVSAAAVAGTAQPANAQAINWDREADVVVLGAGAGGLVASIAAREKGAKILYAHLGGAPALNGYAYAFRNG